jgi:hypothetical protein
MSSKHRFDPLGLAELDSSLGDDAAGQDATGMPGDRAARIAARRAFVDMKLLFIRSVANLEHRKGAWLRRQVRAAEDPMDLWLIRGPLLAALREDDKTRSLRAELYRSLDTTFPMAFAAAALAPAQLLKSRPTHAVIEARFSNAR